MKVDAALPTWLSERYGFKAVPEVSLIRSYTHHVYHVRQENQQFVLKIYIANRRTNDDIQYEIELLIHLAAKGLAVAKPIPAKDSTILQDFNSQPAVLFEYAAGEKPQPPFSEALYIQFGKTIATMHRLSDDFVTQAQRLDIDLDYLVDDPLNFIIPLLADTEKQSALRSAGAEIKSRLLELNTPPLDWGPIHGDATLDNLHVDQEGNIILYDFDSGGCGWRASDLQGWGVNNEEYHSRYQAFLEGYSSVRSLTNRDIRASVVLTSAWDIWGMQADLENRVLRQDADEIQTYLEHQLTHVLSRWDAVK